jgi:hypothetical protein
LLVNKLDLRDEWTIAAEALDELERAGWAVRFASAKTGHAVEDAFRELAELMLRPSSAAC